MSKRKLNNEVNEINELLKILRVSKNKKRNESPVSKKKKSGSPGSSKKRSRSPSPDSNLPTEANKNAARKVRVALTKTVGGQRVAKTKQELLRDIACKQREENFYKRYPHEKYPYLNEINYVNYCMEYAKNGTNALNLNSYGKILKNFDNEARRNYGN